jgi:hypothetical protein
VESTPKNQSLSYILQWLVLRLRKRTLLTSDHGIPSNSQQEYGDIAHIATRIQELEKLDDKTDGIRYYAECCNKHAPKIESMIALKGNKDQYDELNSII